MNTVAKYLRKHLNGEVYTDNHVLDWFSTDGSVFRIKPKIVIYPRNATDVRKVARFSWQLAEQGKKLPLTARGKGTDQGGAALGEGLMLVFPAHMNHVIEINKNTVKVQPGEIYGTLQKILMTHGRYLPPYPSSIEFSTIGGAVANNAAGERTVKYGQTKDFVKSLQVVLANGEVITTGRLSKRELSKKMGETNFEGGIYRQLDALISDNWELIQQSRPRTSKNAAGYNIWDVKRKDGSFDLTPLIVGSQGTLGVVTEIELKTEPYNPHSSLVAAYFDDMEQAGAAVLELHKLKPVAMEIVDRNLLEFLKKRHTHDLDGLVDEPFPKIILLIEFDESNSSARKKKVKQAKKILSSLAREFSVTDDPHEQALLWKIRHSAAAVTSAAEGKSKALPIIEDGVVPKEHLAEFLEGAYKLFKKHHLQIAVWGHAGDGNLHMQPFLDLSNVSDRQKTFKLMDEFYKMVIDMGGSISAEHNDGRIRGSYLKQMFGDDVYDLFEYIKAVFDPHGFLNPDVKLGVTRKDQTAALRHSYDMSHLYEHLPRT